MLDPKNTKDRYVFLPLIICRSKHRSVLILIVTAHTFVEREGGTSVYREGVFRRNGPRENRIFVSPVGVAMNVPACT